MARKKPARPAAKKAPKRAAARKPAKKAVRAVKKALKAASRTARRTAKKTTRRAAAQVKKAKVRIKKAALTPRKKPNLDRPRKTVADIHGLPSSLSQGSLSSAARSGRSEMKHRQEAYTSTSPALTAGDVDANWQAAESSGDEAPGGDNPTPDQDVVDEIGRALGVEYGDDEELQGGEEITNRDRHRWELDPGSKDDFDEE